MRKMHEGSKGQRFRRIVDIELLLDLVGRGMPELDFDGDDRAEHREALTTLLSIRPDLEGDLREKIKCTAFFQEW